MAGRRQHPLKNILVLDKLLEYVSEDELPSFRLVCRIWFLTSLEKWRSTRTLTVHSFDDDSYPQAVECEDLREFYNLSSHPYLKLVLDGKKTAFKPLLLRGVNFWYHCGLSLTHLTFKDIGVYFNIDYFVDVILFKTPNVTDLVFIHNSWGDGTISMCPHWHQPPIPNNLRRFAIIGNPGKKSDVIQMSVPWYPFFRHFQKLETLEISSVSSCGFKCYDYFGLLVSALKFAESDFGKSSLKNMKLTLAQPSSARKDLRAKWSSLGVVPSEKVPAMTRLFFLDFCQLSLPHLNEITMDLGVKIMKQSRLQLVKRFPFIKFEN